MKDLGNEVDIVFNYFSLVKYVMGSNLWTYSYCRSELSEIYLFIY